MTPQPTGRLFRSADGDELILTRTFRAPVEDVWASVTDPERTARWFGPWEGQGAPGRSVRVRLAFEEGEPWSEVRIDACEPPRRLVVTTQDDYGSWRLEIRLTGTDDGHTRLALVHHLTGTEGLGEVGPGWEYYLDRLVTSRDGGDLPEFEAYYPAQKAYFEGLTPLPPED